MRNLKALFAVAAVLTAFSVDALAAVVANHSLTKVFGPSAAVGTKITDINADTSNRVWFTTNKLGLTAMSNTELATGFPWYSTLLDQGFTTNLSSVAFGPAGTDKQPHFFLGANGPASGVLYGRMLDATPSFGVDKLLNDKLLAEHQTTKVNAIINNDDKSFWLATDVGLTWANLPVLTISDVIYTPNAADTNIIFAADADPALSGGEAFFATAAEFYMVNPTSPNGFLSFGMSSQLGGVGGISVDASGNLWVAESVNTSVTRRKILRYAAEDLRAWSRGGSKPDPMISYFDPADSLSAYKSSRNINLLKVSPSSREIWIGTTAGAFFQKPGLTGALGGKVCGPGVDWESSLDDVDAQGGACTAAGSGWRPAPQSATEVSPQINENFSGIFLDTSGNSWLGSNEQIRAVLTRNLTLSGSRFVNDSARVTVNLLDERAAPEDAEIKVQVGSNIRDFRMTETAPGKYVFSFGFTLNQGADPSVPPYQFPVVATSVENILVTYTYKDEEDVTHTITLAATWVQVVPFKDTFIVGGPCFIDTAGR